MTNEEYLKQLPTREFAEYLFDKGNCHEYRHGICAYQDECEYNYDETSDEFCLEQICKFLKQEKEEEW